MKAILQIPNSKFVLSLEEAVTISSILARSEVYQSKYRSGGTNTHHIHNNPTDEIAAIRVISEDFYNMCRLAGAPE